MRAGAWFRPLVFAFAVGCSADGDKTPDTSSGTGADTGTGAGSETRTATETGSGTRTDTGTATGTRTGVGIGTGSRTDTGTGTGTPASGDGADYVDAHNAVRAAVVKPTNYPAGQTWEPIPPVTWSASVAATAQAWADHLVASGCVLEHAKSGYGENLAMGTNLTARGAVALWAGEKTAYSYNARYQFESSTGHYTQLVWRKSTQIGCGSATCNRAVIVCCRYSPPGNTIGQQPY